MKKKYIFILSMFSMGIVLSFFLLWSYLKKSAWDRFIRTQDVLSILVNIHEGDTLLTSAIFLLDYDQEKIGIILLPNDLAFVIDQFPTLSALKFIFSYDPELYQDVLEKEFNISFNFNLFLSPKEWSSFINLLGGIRLFNFEAQDLKTVGEKNVRTIRLKEGKVLWTGERSVQYLKYKPYMSDYTELYAYLSQFWMGLVKPDYHSIWTNNSTFTRRTQQIFAKHNISVHFFSYLLSTPIESIYFHMIKGQWQFINDKRLYISELDNLERVIPNFIRELNMDREQYFFSERLFSLDILNGTTRNRLAYKTSLLFSTLEYTSLLTVNRISNAERNNYEKTILLLSDESQLEAAQKIKKIFSCMRILWLPYNYFLDNAISSQMQLILGKNVEGERC